MPQATNITIKDGANVDKTFTLIAPASGDGGIAEWALKEGTIASVFPRFTASAARTGNRSRKLTLKVRVPSSYQDSVTGLTNVGSAVEFNGSITVPDDFPEGKKADHVAFVANLINSALVKSMLSDAYPAT